jgi:hypothetical protein
MEINMTMVRVRRRCSEVRKGPGKGREQRTGMGNGRGRQTDKGKILLNKRQGDVISFVALGCSCRRKDIRQTRARRANNTLFIYSRKHRPPCQDVQTMTEPLPTKPDGE